MTRPISEIIAASAQDSEADLTCDECFNLLEYLAEAAAQGAGPQDVLPIARRHLVHCPDCRLHHESRLKALETRLSASKDPSG